MTEDITYCVDANEKDPACSKCDRNPKNIRMHWMPHSFAKLSGSCYCDREEVKNGNSKEDKNGCRS